MKTLSTTHDFLPQPMAFAAEARTLREEINRINEAVDKIRTMCDLTVRASAPSAVAEERGSAAPAPSAGASDPVFPQQRVAALIREALDLQDKLSKTIATTESLTKVLAELTAPVFIPEHARDIKALKTQMP